jgi:hypothetical protein
LKDTTGATNSEVGVSELESDEELERALRRELSEMVCTKGASDPNTMLEIVLGGLGKNADKV